MSDGLLLLLASSGASGATLPPRSPMLGYSLAMIVLACWWAAATVFTKSRGRRRRRAVATMVREGRTEIMLMFVLPERQIRREEHFAGGKLGLAFVCVK